MVRVEDRICNLNKFWVVVGRGFVYFMILRDINICLLILMDYFVD